MSDVALAQIRHSLLGQGCPALSPGDGYRAFQEHKLLATAIHRATHLDRRKAESETDAWVRYLTQFFPSGRNSRTDARTLFGDWRTSLLKQDAPGPGVLVTHGQSTAHWVRDGAGRLCLNLEDMWRDFETSVDRFLAWLEENPPRMSVVRERWSRSVWDVQVFEPATGFPVATVMAASAAVRNPNS